MSLSEAGDVDPSTNLSFRYMSPNVVKTMTQDPPTIFQVLELFGSIYNSGLNIFNIVGGFLM